MTTQQTRPRKFTFDAQFDGGSSAARGSSSVRAKNFFTPEEVENIRQAAYDQGRGSLEAIAAQSQSMALGQIASAVMTALGTIDAMTAEARTTAVETALAASKAIAGVALSHFSQDVIEDVISRCLAENTQQAQISVRLPPQNVSAIRERLTALASDAGFGGRVTIIADPSLTVADCRLEWPDGGIERHADQIAARITHIVERFSSAILDSTSNQAGATP